MGRVDYRSYLASREWGLKRRAVKERAGGVCERCKKAPMRYTHHLSYRNLGNEPLEDLQGLCRGCHAYLGGYSDRDPRPLCTLCDAALEQEGQYCSSCEGQAEGVPGALTPNQCRPSPRRTRSNPSFRTGASAW
jgi:hypothetical protein